MFRSNNLNMIANKRLIINTLIILVTLMITVNPNLSAQTYRFEATLSPLITWFGVKNDNVSNEGARPGSEITFRIERYFTDNIAWTGGLSLLSAGGRLRCSTPVDFRLHSGTVTVDPLKPIVYKIMYLSFPVGLKFKTNERNLLSYFASLGLDPEIVVKGRVNIPALDLKNERAMPEIKRFNIGYHLNAGAGYAVSEDIILSFGFGFENNFIDVTRDVGSQVHDHVAHRIFKFIFGINFPAFRE